MKKYTQRLFLLSIVFLFSCKHQSQVLSQNSAEVRSPAQDQQMATGLLKQEFIKLRISQTLVAEFDLRLASYKTESEMDSLLQSELYCKLMSVRHLHESAENQLVYALKMAKQLDAQHVNWFYSEINSFLNEAKTFKYYPTYVATIGQLFIELVSNEIEICGAKNCVAKDLNLIRGLGVNPLDQKTFEKYISANRFQIAIADERFNAAGKYEMAPLKPGTCIQNNPTRKPQSTKYDWKNRNWVGSVLPVGSFVITYDDGPHATYTRQIRDTWANAGMPKPAFFWLRKNVSNLPAIAQELNNQNYVIGSHSERHADLGTLAKANSPADFNSIDRQIFGDETKNLSPADFAIWKSKALDREINQSVADLSVILKKPVRYFRLPFGSGLNNDMIGDRFEALNLDHFFWKVDSLDWQDKNPNSIRDRVVAQMGLVKKGIVLFHDVHPQSAAAAQLLVNYFKSNPSMKAVSIMDLPGLKL
jgi:peptidoglycan/xylan/chitin deacetylase (PgdA/CDA1 family)